MKKNSLFVFAILLVSGLAGEAFALSSQELKGKENMVVAADRNQGALNGEDREEDESRESEEGLPSRSAKIPLQEAIQIALAQAPGSVHQAKLEEEDGSLLYEVSIAHEDRSLTEIKIDAQSGKVLKVEKEGTGETGGEENEG